MWSVGYKKIGRRCHSLFGQSRYLSQSRFDEVIDRRYTGSSKWDRYAINRDTPQMIYPEGLLAMWVADTEFKAPDEVISAVQSKAAEGIFGYVYPTFELRHAICSYMHRRHNASIQPESIVFLPGLGVGLSLIARMAATAQEAVMTAIPVYPPFMNNVRYAGTDLYTTALKRDGFEWSLDFDEMHDLVKKSQTTSKPIKWFMLCNPHNPVGKVFRQYELEELAQFCSAYSIKVCSDEVHADIILDDELKHIPFSNISPDYTITLNSPSKAYNVAALCAAFAVPGNEELAVAMKHEMRGMMPEGNILGLVGMEAAYKYGEPWLEEATEYLKNNRKYIMEALDGTGVMESNIESTYLAWLNAEKLYSLPNRTSLESKDPRQSYARRIFQDFTIGLNDGSAFGPDGHMYKENVRLNFACSMQQLTEAITRLIG